MADWKTGRYSSYSLDLGSDLIVYVNWTTKRDDPKPWRIRVFGDDLGGERQLEDAKKRAEQEAEKRLKRALELLRPVTPAET